ncbi:MAG: Hemerythrin cation binding domain [Cyanobacteria bacterium RYN_339]|nr:Hemerythrin cation binding domain [Cyanobacteria bacterium RYN_339]
MSLRHYPAIAHEHGDLRHELTSFAMVLNAANCPPPGHAFHQVLGAIVAYFDHDLPAHVEEEERDYYPLLAGAVSPAHIARMREQHQAMLVMAQMFGRQHQAFVEAATEQAWAELRHIGKRLVDAIRQHLDFEEAILGQTAPHGPPHL